MDIDWDGWSPPNSFVCPISGELMVDPVTCVDGHSYEKGCILRWFRESRVTSPVTGIALDSATVFPNHALRNAIEEWKLQLRGRRPASRQHPCTTATTATAARRTAAGRTAAHYVVAGGSTRGRGERNGACHQRGVAAARAGGARARG